MCTDTSQEIVFRTTPKSWWTVAGVLAIAVAAGCSSKTVSTSQTDNAEVPVGLLFTHDGCKVYRFTDGGRSHYFANCPGSSVSGYYSCGKGCTREEQIPTVEAPL